MPTYRDRKDGRALVLGKTLGRKLPFSWASTSQKIADGEPYSISCHPHLWSATLSMCFNIDNDLNCHVCHSQWQIQGRPTSSLSAAESGCHWTFRTPLNLFTRCVSGCLDRRNEMCSSGMLSAIAVESESHKISLLLIANHWNKSLISYSEAERINNTQLYITRKDFMPHLP